MRIAVAMPGPTVSPADVYAGLVYGLRQHGVDVVPIGMWATDAVIFVTAIRWERAAMQRVIDMLGVPAAALFTESPYEHEKELAVAAIVDGCWTHERTAVAAFGAVNPHVAYLPHAWHPGVHTATPQPGDELVPAHDVVFVGSGFRERVSFFNAIDWTGIDLGLYGIWHGLGLKDALTPCIWSDEPIANTQAAALYRRAKIGLNLYRRLKNLGADVPANWVTAESLNPRAYELAACGCLQISEYRDEVLDVLGGTPLFGSPHAAEMQVRAWLRYAAGRPGLVDQAVAQVADCSWVDRAGQVLRDLHTWGLTASAS